MWNEKITNLIAVNDKASQFEEALLYVEVKCKNKITLRYLKLLVRVKGGCIMAQGNVQDLLSRSYRI